LEEDAWEDWDGLDGAALTASGRLLTLGPRAERNRLSGTLPLNFDSQACKNFLMTDQNKVESSGNVLVSMEKAGGSK